MSDARLSTIADRIRLLGTVDQARRVFGANRHAYQLAPPLTAAELAALEARLGATLSEEYRAFVRTLGRSGAGPYYGLVEPVVESPSAVIVAEQGAGMRSLLVIAGSQRGQVWAAADGSKRLEARGFFGWYEQWIERALGEWAEVTAPRIAIDGPEHPAELEAIELVFDAIRGAAPSHPAVRRTLGYLHLRERRFDDAAAAFAAAVVDGGQEPIARLALDRARLLLVRGEPGEALEVLERALAATGEFYATRDQLRELQERLLVELDRRDDALRVLEGRAAEAYFSFDLHHRLARERLVRNDLDGAGAALERAAQMANILGRPAPIENRVPRAFEPIIAELRAAGRPVDAEALAARAEMILGGN